MPAKGNAVLITGASSGIGRELARLFAADGNPLVLVARGTSGLAQAAAELRQAHRAEVTTIPADLSVPAEIYRLADRVGSAGIHVGVLVNNAGFGAGGPFARSELGTGLGMIAVNVAAVTHLTRLLLPAMVERKEGRILNVGSTAGFQPGPYMAVYYATKAYLLSFSEALAEELKGTGVTVTTLCPGPTETGFAARAGILPSRLFRSATVMSAAAVARAGHAGVLRGDRIVVPGAINKAVSQAGRLLPRRVLARIAARLNRDRAPRR
jgi:short-subunit dehydrogenase